MGLPTCTSVDFGGNAEFTGVVYAPQAHVQMARWRDGTILSLVFNRRALEMNMTMVEKQVNVFVSFDAE